MEQQSSFPLQLSSNQLKLIALLAMTIDHIGLVLLPQYEILRIIGRLAYPIFAYMIAEGCRYTSHKVRYLGIVFGVGLLCQIVYLLTTRSIYQCIMMTFSLAIALIFTIDWARAQGGKRWALVFLSLFFAAFVCEGLPLLLKHTDFGIDYGFTGVMLPVFIFLGQNKKERLLAAALGLILVALQAGGVQWFGLLALLPLACYNGKRGKWKLKYLFYIYYPLHLAVIWGINLLLIGL